ncbi:F-box domain [Macleaya cordata]|uniref:F-box domain n=1 Tax=Macleaya cordata TaxID=56857 RepID=A0A200QP41_MACCD|nr:F-box domain [Macleaya cordata]
MMEPQLPHEALSLVLSYLNLFELLSMNEVCRTLRDAVNNDVLIWLDIIIEPPLSVRLNDDILLTITSKAKGRLRSLALINCAEITDDGLQRVIQNNPHINKLYVPGCTRLTPDGILRIVRRLTDDDDNHNLKYLRLHGLYNITKEHLQLLNSCLQVNQDEQKDPLEDRHYKFLHNQRCFSSFNDDETNNPIDVEICPKCENVRLVYDCPKENCRKKRATPLMECRGCCLCIPRCEGCGGCVNQAEEELEETVCLDVLCLNCWLQLPKCNLCNRPYCHRHADKYESMSSTTASSTGFICDVCISRIEALL